MRTKLIKNYEIVNSGLLCVSLGILDLKKDLLPDGSSWNSVCAACGTGYKMPKDKQSGT